MSGDKQVSAGDQASAQRATSPRRALLLALGALGAAIAFYLGMIVGSSSDIPANTTVLGVQIGGMARAEAVAALESTITPVSRDPISITAFESFEDIDPADAGMAFDPIATVDAAEARILNPITLVMRLFGPREVAPVVTIDEALVAEQVEVFAEAIRVETVQPSIYYEGVTPVLSPGQDGRDVDIPAAVEVLSSSYLVERGTVALPELILEPAVSNSEAEEYLAGPATIAVSGPVTIEVEDVAPQVAPETIAKATIYLVQEGELSPKIDGAVLHDAIAEELAPVEEPGNNATFTIDDNNVPVVVPSQVGSGVSDPDLAAAVGEAIFKEGEERVASAIVTVRDPTLTTADAEQLGVVEEISSFTQQVNYAEYLAHNLSVASEYINGTLLLPGEVFSMNDTTENRDPENGYMEGWVIGPGGIFRKALGGGLSAATTTVWTAAFYAGLEPVEVQAHSVYISRYVPGLEATVSWDSFDMKFRNNTPYGVFITASSNETSMTVRMYSTKMYTAIEAEVGERLAITKNRKIYNESPECSAQAGGDGFTVNVDRIFFEGTTEVKRETFTTTYRPAPQVICGPKPDKKKKDKEKEEEENGETSPSPSPSPTPSPTESPEALAQPAVAAGPIRGTSEPGRLG